jgi:hypothetical protein
MSFAFNYSAAFSVAIVAIGIAASSGTSAQTPDSTLPGSICFDVIRPLSGEAAGAILVNRCTGRTWILVSSRNRHAGEIAYRWASIGTDDAETSAAPAAPARSRIRHAPLNPNSDKCFTFQGKRYCE